MEGASKRTSRNYFFSPKNEERKQKKSGREEAEAEEGFKHRSRTYFFLKQKEGK
jgi:hypothetical protein